jgi:hypothetical protein
VKGRFWASDNDSEADEEVDLTVDSLVASMSNLSLASPPFEVAEASMVRALVVHSASSSSSSKTPSRRIQYEVVGGVVAYTEGFTEVEHR